jgi:MFS family permease
MFINFSPLLKYRQYRILYAGQFVSAFGNMLTYVVLPFQIYSLTHSSLAVGNIGLIQLIPLLVTSLWGGALADSISRKKLLIFIELGMLITSILLLLNSLLPHSHIWGIYILAAVNSGLCGFYRPVLEGMTQSIIEYNDIPAISSLTSFRHGVTMIGGPALAGLVLAKWSISFLYALDTLTYVASLVVAFVIQIPPLPKKTIEPILKSIKEGLSYAISREDLFGTYLVDFVAIIFGMPIALFPTIAETFHFKTAIGWLYAAPSIGMLVTALCSGWVTKIHRHGLAITCSACIWGLAIIAFGLSHNFLVACFFLIIAGGADAMSVLFRTTLCNQTIPQNLRGRMAGIEMITFMSGPLLGNAEAGIVAAGFGTKFSIVSGGVMCVLAVVIVTFLLPKFWKYSNLNELVLN